MRFFSRERDEEIKTLQTDIEELERERTNLKERLKQLTKSIFVDDLGQKKSGIAQKLSGVLSTKKNRHSISFLFLHSDQATESIPSPQSLPTVPVNEHEVII